MSAEWGQSGKEWDSFFHILYIGCQQKEQPRLKGIFSHLKKKNWIKGLSSHHKRSILKAALSSHTCPGSWPGWVRETLEVPGSWHHYGKQIHGERGQQNVSCHVERGRSKGLKTVKIILRWVACLPLGAMVTSGPGLLPRPYLGFWPVISVVSIDVCGFGYYWMSWV